MSTRVAINGFGRIGRAVPRAAFEREAEIEIVAVNDVTGTPGSPSCSPGTPSTAASRHP